MRKYKKLVQEMDSPNGFQKVFQSELNKSGKGQVTKTFLLKLIYLLRIAIPSPTCREVKIMLFLSTTLILRSFMSIWIAAVNGSVVKTIVSRDFRGFLREIGRLASFAVPACFVNSAIEYLSREFSTQLRWRMTKYFLNLYFRRFSYYKMTNIDSRINQPEQRLTQDVEKWAHTVSQLFSNVSKPVLDIVLFSRKLSQLVGVEGPLLVIGWYTVSAIAIKIVSPAFGELIAEEQELEGEYRAAHMNVVINSEEIAFYQGGEYEKKKLESLFDQVTRHVRGVLQKRFWMGGLDSLLIKYGAVLLGYAVVGLPVFGPKKLLYAQINGGADSAAITQDYVRNSSLLINLAKAIGRLVVSYKDIQALAGHTESVFQMTEVFHSFERGEYVNYAHEHAVTGQLISQYHQQQQKQMLLEKQIGDEENHQQGRLRTLAESLHEETQKQTHAGHANHMSRLNQHDEFPEEEEGDLDGDRLAMFEFEQGEVIASDSNDIVFEGVPICTPDGQLLLDGLTLRIQPGMNIFILGPNGCGKSSLFRVLSGLWPIVAGRIIKPRNPKALFYLPQQPYLFAGSLREQIIYPETLEEFKAKYVKMVRRKKLPPSHNGKKQHSLEHVQENDEVLNALSMVDVSNIAKKVVKKSNMTQRISRSNVAPHQHSASVVALHSSSHPLNNDAASSSLLSSSASTEHLNSPQDEIFINTQEENQQKPHSFSSDSLPCTAQHNSQTSAPLSSDSPTPATSPVQPSPPTQHTNDFDSSVYEEVEDWSQADSILLSLMDKVKLSYLPSRWADGLFSHADWSEILSGGEKQRLAMARLLYNKPIYAVLDEATSAVSVDVEGALYQLCLDAGISVVSISHRMSLLKFHNHLLRLDGRGGWRCEVLPADLIASTTANANNQEQIMNNQSLTSASSSSPHQQVNSASPINAYGDFPHPVANHFSKSATLSSSAAVSPRPILTPQATATLATSNADHADSAVALRVSPSPSSGLRRQYSFTHTDELYSQNARDAAHSYAPLAHLPNPSGTTILFPTTPYLSHHHHAPTGVAAAPAGGTACSSRRTQNPHLSLGSANNSSSANLASIAGANVSGTGTSTLSGSHKRNVPSISRIASVPSGANTYHLHNSFPFSAVANNLANNNAASNGSSLHQSRTQMMNLPLPSSFLSNIPVVGLNSGSTGGLASAFASVSPNTIPSSPVDLGGVFSTLDFNNSLSNSNPTTTFNLCPSQQKTTQTAIQAQQMTVPPQSSSSASSTTSPSATINTVVSNPNGLKRVDSLTSFMLLADISKPLDTIAKEIAYSGSANLINYNFNGNTSNKD
eukprot:GDKJ01050058.1.p1 GENE.GDKJ01050058.1~~GDKJ01050058.1.p1  ORF type:complete len:1348 (-),score=367.43 GDKJ01050058.1:221-4150(-)